MVRIVVEKSERGGGFTLELKVSFPIPIFRSEMCAFGYAAYERLDAITIPMVSGDRSELLIVLAISHPYQKTKP